MEKILGLGVAGVLFLFLFAAPVSGAKKDCPGGEYWRSSIGKCVSCSLDCSIGSIRFCPIDCQTSPTVPKILGTTELVEGDDLNLTCLPTGRPYPEISWSFNSVALNTNQRITFPKRNTININGIRTTDAGSYTCIAVNDRGNARLTQTVTVQAKKCKEGNYFERAIRSCRQCGDVSFCHQNDSNKCPNECNGWHPTGYKSDVISKEQKINPVGKDTKKTANPNNAAHEGLGVGLGVGIPVVIIIIIILVVIVVLKQKRAQAKRHPETRDAEDQDPEDGADIELIDHENDQRQRHDPVPDNRHGIQDNRPDNLAGEPGNPHSIITLHGNDQQDPCQNRNLENTAISVNHADSPGTPQAVVSRQNQPQTNRSPQLGYLRNGQAKIDPLPTEETNEISEGNSCVL